MIASGMERQGTLAAERASVSLRLSPALAGLMALFAVGLILRLAELDRIPLGEGEARQALAALDLLNPQGQVARRRWRVPPFSPHRRCYSASSAVAK